MRTYLLAAVASIAMAAPATAWATPYVGIEGGILKLQDADLEYQGFDGSEDGSLTVDHKLGLDADLILGYDFGMIRAEAELGFKRAGVDETSVSIPNFGPLFVDGGKARTVSAMANVLLDFGDED